MSSKKLNQKMTLLTLVVALGVAVYLNWEYAKSTDLALDAAEANAPVTTTGVVTDALAVDGDVETGDKNYGEAQTSSSRRALTAPRPGTTRWTPCRRA